MDIKNKMEKLRETINKIDKDQLKADAEALWEVILPALLEGVDEKDEKFMTAVLQSQWDYIQDCNHRNVFEFEGEDISKITVPVVRRIYADFPIKNLVAVQPITELVDTIYALETSSVETEVAGGMLGSGGKRLVVNIVEQKVEAGARKLQAGWTPVKKEDLVHACGLDLESEKTLALSQEVRADITYEVLNDLKRLGGEPEVVKFEGASESDRKNSLLALVCRIRANCSGIARTTRRGHGNWIVVSKAMARALAKDKTTEIYLKDDYKSRNSEMLNVGTINHGIDVFVANVPDDEILIGYKGKNGEADSGYFYCPHTPLMTGGTCVHPTTFEPVLPFMTRYGKFVTEQAPAYYRNIKVEGALLKK